MEKGVANLIVLVIKSKPYKVLQHYRRGAQTQALKFKIELHRPGFKLENYTLNSTHLICKLKIAGLENLIPQIEPHSLGL